MQPFHYSSLLETATVPRITELRRDAIKQAIYEAAAAVLTRDGVEHTTMDSVALEAGVAKGSLYNYFRSKDDLLKFVYEKTVEPLQQEIEAIVDSPSPTLAKLQRVLQAIYSYLEEHRQLFSFLLSQQTIHEIATPCHAPGLSALESLIQQGMDKKDFRPGDAQFHATLIFGAIRGIGDEFMAQDDPWPVRKMVDDTYQFCAAGLVRESGALVVAMDGADSPR